MKQLNRQHLVQALLTLVLICMLPSVHAIVPQTMNYQGHLTNSAGEPVDSAVNMVFAIYDVETGGTPLWSDTRSVTVNQGVFSVELGDAGNPFPLVLFENPLWMGLTVGTDAEMTPRRPISSVGFAFKAGDADTLEGISAASLDQSAHLSDGSNPHGVSPAQIGAADAATLSAHTANTANPHSVSAAQTGAATSAEFTTHTASSAAHHLRYSNAEAVAAMGAKNNTNALNHDRYTDSNVVTAMLANDGAGSTLDSDKVDGLEASEIIDAAQDEVRTPISSLPFTINASGSYYLTGNLDGSSGGLDITADKVTLDLMGFTIDGGGTVNDYGIDFTARSSIVIRNGIIANFGLAGIYQGNTTARYATVVDVQALGNGTLGTGYLHSGIFLYSSNSHIERCTAGDNGGYGILAFPSSKLINNTAYNNSGAYGIYGGTGASLAGNTAYGNSGTGIYGGSGASLAGNTAYNNSSYGIFGGTGASLTGNTAYNNSGTGIYGNNGASLTGNIASYNTNWGIYATASNLVKDNTLISNNQSANATLGGLYVGFDSRVIGNSLDSNSQNNIYVNSSDNILRENHVTDSINGIFFSSSGNYYRENTGSGNTTDFNLNGTIQTNGGGNVSF